MKKFFTLTLALMATITLWADSGVITAASTTDLGKGNTPRYVVEEAGVGRLMKNATGSSSWSASSGYLQTGSSKFALQTYNEISSIIITGYGTGSGRTFSSLRVGTTTSNYEAASATGSGEMSSTASDQTITITPASNIAADSYVEITLSGNINIASVELVYAAAAVTHALAWDFAGGDCSATAGTDYTAAGQVAEGATITYPANNTMTKDGFAFNGWSTSATTMPTSDLTITAQWAAPSATPTITSQPSTSAVEYLQNETAEPLSVEATGAGTLSYQWYSNTEAATTGENLVEIDGATNASYTPSTTTLGTLYYFCAVTNTETSKAPTTVNSNLSGAITVVTNPVGEHTLTWTVRVENSETTITTIGKNPTSIHLGSMSNIAINGGLTVDNSGKNGGTGKIKPTNGEKVAANYLSMTFTVADGYTFTPTTYTMSTTAVSAEKTVEVEISDTHGHSKSATWSQPKTSSTPDSHNYDLSGSAYEGIVTLKIYVYNDADDNGYRLGSSIVLAGTVAAIDYNVNFAAGDGSGEMEPLANKHVGDEVELPACTFTAPDGYAFAAWTSTDVTITDNKFTMPASNVTVTATYAQLFAITCAVAENGTVTADKAQAIAGETVTLTLTPASGYKVASVKVNDGDPLAVSDNKATFTMPAAAANVVATFSVATALDNTEDEVKAVKVLRDGQLFIEKNGHVYNAFGACVK